MKKASKVELVKHIARELQLFPFDMRVSKVWNGALHGTEQKATTFVNLIIKGDYKKAATKYSYEELQDIIYFAE